MEKLKSYYKHEAELQPNPSIKMTFEPVSGKRRLNLVRRTFLVAAVVTLLTASLMAAGALLLSTMPSWFSSEELFGKEGGNIAQIEAYAHPFSIEFRAYIDADDWMREDSWDGEFSYYTIAEDLVFPSMAAASEFFSVIFAQNPLTPDVSIDIYKTIVAYDPILDNANITIFSNTRNENDRLISINLSFRIDNEPSEPFNMSFVFYDGYGFGVEEGAEQYYISPVNGFEALLLPFSPNSAQAIFALNNVLYTLSIDGGSMVIGDDTIHNPDINTTDKAIAALKEIIDAYHR
jgi:hypothetical protein